MTIGDVDAAGSTQVHHQCGSVDQCRESVIGGGVTTKRGVVQPLGGGIMAGGTVAVDVPRPAQRQSLGAATLGRAIDAVVEWERRGEGGKSNLMLESARRTYRISGGPKDQYVNA